MERYAVTVEDGKRGRTRSCRWGLRRLGLHRENEFRYRGTVTGSRGAARVKAFCRKKHLRFRFDNGYGRRSTSYRENFLKTYPALPGGRYRCVYCGRKVRADDMTVDHLYPVAKVSSDIRLQKKLKAMGVSGVNAAGNLVPACARCNKRKGARMGLWILKGRLGRTAWYWPLRKALRFAIAAVTAAAVLRMCRGVLAAQDLQQAAEVVAKCLRQGFSVFFR